MIVQGLQVTQHWRATIAVRHYAVNEIRAWRVQHLLWNTPANMPQQELDFFP